MSGTRKRKRKKGRGYYFTPFSQSGSIFMKNKNVLYRLVPTDTFNILNGIFGIFAIFSALEGNNYHALIFVLLAILADGIDGITARIYDSELSRYLNEFSNITSFCIAPCIATYNVYNIHDNIIFFSVASLFLISGVLHLINYHINEKNYFIGIPTTASAIIIMSLVYISFPLWSVICIFVALAVLMVTPITYPRIERSWAIAAFVLIFSAMTGWSKFVTLLLLTTTIYSILGPFYMKTERLTMLR